MKAELLESERLLYKPLSIEHLSREYISWLNDPEVTKYLETGGNYTMDMLKDYLIEIEQKEILFWGIHIKESLIHIGNIKIDPINLRHNVAEYGIMMGRKSEWGKGYAKEASQTIIDYCFKKLGIRKISLGVVANNLTAYNLYKKLGFETEGILKKDGIYGGTYCDGIRMAIFNPRFIYE